MAKESVFKSETRLFWVGGDCPVQNVYVHFRGKLGIGDSSYQTIFRIYAKDIYELYVNGCFIGMGPCVNAPPLIYYDEWDLDGKLVQGENLFAIKVHHGGHISPKDFQFGGLICELELTLEGGKRFLMNEPADWMCGISRSYSFDASKNVGCVGFSEHYSLDGDEHLWHTTDFDDTNFKPPVAGRTIPASYWRKRPIPHFRIETKSPRSIKRVDDETIADFGEMVSGRPRIEGRSGVSIEVKVSYVENLCSGWARSEGRQEMYSDILTTGRPGPFKWQSFNKRAFRYLKISGAACDIDSIAIDSYAYPLKGIGSFQCSDNVLNRIWDICDRTLRICIDDIYNDCPHRDKAQWMDAFMTSRVALSLYGLRALTEKCLDQYGICSLLDGRLMSPSINGDALLPDYALIYIQFVLWHFHVTGDRAALERLFPGALEIIGFFKKFQDADGLLKDVDKNEGFVYLDNTFELNKKGKSSAVNALYFGAAKSVSEMACHLGKEGLAAEFKGLGSRIQDAFKSAFRHPNIKGCFVDAVPAIKKDYLNINFSCEFGKWKGSGARARTFIHADSECSLNLECAVYAGLGIVSGGQCIDLPKSPDWAENPMYFPASISLSLKNGWNEIVFEVEANSLNWDLYIRGADSALPPISASRSFDDRDSFLIEEIDWQNRKSSGNKKTVRARLWTTPELSQSTHGYIGFCEVTGSLEQDKEMLRQILSANGYTRNYLSIRVPFFCRETENKDELKRWILPCNTPGAAFFLLVALFKCGMGRDALEWIRMAWGKMMEMGAVNCWEDWSDRSSLCHAWGSVPAYLMHREVLGVSHECLWKGMVVIKPDLMGLEWATGTVAIGSDGAEFVKISLKNEGSRTRVDLDVPSHYKLSLDMSKLQNPVLVLKRP